jgi:hypothetical protein
MKLFKRVTPETVEFCDRCGSVCDSSCRRAAVRERNLDRALSTRLGVQ